jgi:virginiamycin A acetyltransferase
MFPNCSQIPDPNAVFLNETKTSCFIKNVVTASNIEIGDYTYYDDTDDPTGFEQNNVLFNWPGFGDRLVIGKFCSIASGTQFIMGPANHRISSVTTYPFNVFGGAWEANTQPHLSELPRKGDTIVGNDVWFGRQCVIHARGQNRRRRDHYHTRSRYKGCGTILCCGRQSRAFHQEAV